MSQKGSLIARGTTADVFALGADAVVKVPLPNIPSHWAGVEAAHAQAVHAEGLPVPEVLDVIDVDGRDSIVFERIHGPSMWEVMVADVHQVPTLATDMANIHLQIHSLAAPRGLPPLDARLISNINAAEAVPPSERSEAAALVSSLPRGTKLCHGDLHPGNILMSANGPVVIDWFDASSGDTFADVVRTSLLLRPPVSGPVQVSHLPQATRLALDAMHLAYLRAMFKDAAPDAEAARRWEAVLAVSRLAEKAERSEVDLVALWDTRATITAESTPLMDVMRQLAHG